MATVINPFVAVDGNGNVRANAKLYFYQTGTTTLQNTYADAALSAVNTNPVVADSNGLFPAIYLDDPPTVVAYKGVLKTSADVTVWTADPIAGAPLTNSLIAASQLRSYLAGLQRTGSTGTTYDQAVGVANDDTNTVVMSLVSGTINAATVGANGIDAGALTATATFHVHAIGKTDGTTARLLSASPSSPTLPSGYIYKRRTASLRTTVSSQISPYLHPGDMFMLTAPALDISATSPGTSAVTRTLASLPTGITVEPVMSVMLDSDANGEICLLSSLTQTDIAPGSGQGQVSIFASPGVTAVQTAGMINGVITNTSGQIRTRNSSGGSASILRIKTHGWIDRRGRDD
jgi:hypothetical protein